jgi:Ni/Co efflux regulator RcnB
MIRIPTLLVAMALLAAGTGAASAQQGSEPSHDNGRPQQHDERRPVAHEYKRGERIDHDHWDHAAPVDYRAHHLSPPRRGYEWREVDGRYVLAAVATGLIANIILNAH